MWCYVSSFWPDYFESKEVYLLAIDEQLNSGVFYEVTTF